MTESRNIKCQKNKYTAKPPFELLWHPTVMTGISLSVSYTSKLCQGFSSYNLRQNLLDSNMHVLKENNCKKLWNQIVFSHHLTTINVLPPFLIYHFSNFSIKCKKKQIRFHVLFQATNTKMVNLEGLKRHTCGISLIIHLYWYPCFLISLTFTVICVYNSNVSGKMLYNMKSNIL